MASTPEIRRRLLIAGTAGLVASVALPATARAADVVEPDIDSTAEWGARPPAGKVTVLQYRPSKIIIHHTVSANTSDFSRAQAHAHAHWVQDLHMDKNGWIDTGYHFLVSRGGWITEGRHSSLTTLTGGSSFVLGAHTSGQNSEAIGIANEGAYHDGALPPQAQWEVLVVLCAYVCDRYAIPPTEIFGHMDFGTTQCPGIYHDMLPQLRDEVRRALG
ncbi:N-acetylmuramoyl-L-alanine amidase [Wenjunlia vitaminophila]|uniref:N-acetylmuramoyl-L-alanine amidase n=1 Tax=Wenjunlia vitaminophila TaxID=76728 RepID=A0A0T6LUI8_WENVI|nr:peptidoglycan recognition family protein [Wenjunlia vitaminophila]KRV49815.1 N-acetylmuramoyl-L-alanine amidase [Wenjunlia vitaminophila]